MNGLLPRRIQNCALLALALLFTGCGQGNKEDADLVVGDVERGKILAYQHCIACHQFPEPDLLTKRSWEYALTYMGFFLGIEDYDSMQGAPEFAWESIRAREEFVRAAGLFPEAAVLDNSDWEDLKAYYLEAAPVDAIPQQEKPSIQEDEGDFIAAQTQYRMDSAITSMVHIDENNGLLYVHDSGTETLTVLDRNLNFHDAHPSPGVSLVEARVEGEFLYLLSIGDLFASNIGARLGELQRTRVLSGVFMGLDILVSELHRPADFDLADLNGDGTADLLVSNFGDYTGDFSVYYGDPNAGGFVSNPQILSAQPGIVKGEAYDFDGDGDEDILVMMSAGRENVSLFLNGGEGVFTQKTLWEKHPSFGYIGFELRDFNGDGEMDILALNGDNGDSDPYNTLKRDQGLRIYLNRGGLDFEEAYFYPMYGVYGAEVEDFDGDGDMDIAAISFHPDFDLPEPENFTILYQTASMEFSPRSHSSARYGRWLTIDSGDIDADGDVDIVLGAAYAPVGMRDRHMDQFEQLVREGPPILVLKNRAVD